MMDGMQPSDWIQILVFVGSLMIAVAVLKNDIKWIGKTLEEHQKNDSEAFGRLDRDIRELRNDIRGD
jgi:hypothetical protein